jgi:hypothetical protein
MNCSLGAYDAQALALITAALGAATTAHEVVKDDIAARAERTLMVRRLMAAADSGERDPERLKLAALGAVDGLSAQ